MPSGESTVLADVAPARGRLGKTAMTMIVISSVVVLDIATKQWIIQNLQLHEQIRVIGDFFRLTFTYNRGAAFGINIGEHSRIFFLVLALIALCVVAFIHRSTGASDRLRVFALSLVAGGALGNILDRLRYSEGVVDFLDVGIGTTRWPVFNVADSAISVGAVLLLISFYLEGRHERPEQDPGD